MAANPALAAQYAAGVPLQKWCQIRRNMVTKSHKTIMAANPAVKHEASLLVSTTPESPLHRNLSTKRDQSWIVAVAGNPAVVFSTGIPVYTHLQLWNHSGQYITIDSFNYWHGYGEAPKVIQDTQAGNFQVNADPAGSIGGVVYDLAGKLKWIVAWSNAENQPNKAYTQIIEETIPVNWADIYANLGKSGNQFSVSNVIGYSAEVVIDQTSPTPNLTATLRPAA
ncbi:hypothetical protein REPUB_Repub03eG0258200 [Reevesia pubescens]